MRCSPNKGTFKLNVDAATREDGERGNGVVIRDAEGAILAAANWNLPSGLSLHLSEANAAWLVLIQQRSYSQWTWSWKVTVLKS